MKYKRWKLCNDLSMVQKKYIYIYMKNILHITESELDLIIPLNNLDTVRNETLDDFVRIKKRFKKTFKLRKL